MVAARPRKPALKMKRSGCIWGHSSTRQSAECGSNEEKLRDNAQCLACPHERDRLQIPF